MSAAPARADEAAGVRDERPRRRRPRRMIAVAAVLAVAGAGIGAGLAVTHPFAGRAKPTRIDNGAPTALATVRRGPLSARTQLSGTLGYGGDETVVDRAHGTFTRLPRTGQVIHQGHVLYRVDGRPVILLKGASAPAYRALARGTEGADVRQLNTDLVALGYADRSWLDPHSRRFGAATAYALKKLQHHLGAVRTGRLDLGQVVFLPHEKIRVTKVEATRGAPAAPGAIVLRAGSTTRQVTVALDASVQSEVKTGDKVTITLPDGKTTPGRVASVGAVARKASGGGSPTISVKITPLHPGATGRLDQAPVQVSIVTDSVRDALSVPVNALLALAGGGYAVEAVRPDGTHHLVPVTVGLFDDMAGTVQVSGSGLAAGLRVVVPAA